MRSIVLDTHTYHEDPERFYELVKISQLSLSNLSGFYPKFDSWYSKKVIPGLYTGERKILIYIAERNIAGISVLKSSHSEKKLCCLRVAPEFYGSGIGLKLFSASFDSLETDKPLLSVSEENLPTFTKIFNHFKFEIGCEYKDLYRKKKFEFSFNGILKAETNLEQ